VTSPRPCGQPGHADVGRRAEITQYGCELFPRLPPGDTEPRLTCRVHLASSAGSRPCVGEHEHIRLARPNRLQQLRRKGMTTCRHQS
jgi:hypothetical protein